MDDRIGIWSVKSSTYLTYLLTYLQRFFSGKNGRRKPSGNWLIQVEKLWLKRWELVIIDSVRYAAVK